MSSSPEASNGAGQWLFEDIGNLTLDAGRYVIGSVFYSATPLAEFGTAFTTIPELLYTGSREAGTTDGGLVRPDALFGGSPSDGIFGATLRLAEVPIPSTLALLLLGFAGLMARGRARA